MLVLWLSDPARCFPCLPTSKPGWLLSLVGVSLAQKLRYPAHNWVNRLARVCIKAGQQPA